MAYAQKKLCSFHPVYSEYMKKLSTKWFKKWSEKNNLSNEDLLDAIGDLEGRLSTANLGDNLFKVRVKRKHGGKRSGFRTVIVYKKNDRAIFLYGFGKNKRDNIDKTELRYLKKLAGDLLALNSEQLNRSIERKILFDIDMTEDAK